MKQVNKKQFFESVNQNLSKDPMPQYSEITFKKENGCVIESESVWRFANCDLFGKIVNDLYSGKDGYKYFLAI